MHNAHKSKKLNRRNRATNRKCFTTGSVLCSYTYLIESIDLFAVIVAHKTSIITSQKACNFMTSIFRKKTTKMVNVDAQFKLGRHLNYYRCKVINPQYMNVIGRYIDIIL